MRDKEQEQTWRKGKYKRLVADIEKKDAEQFLELLKNDRTAFQTWIKQQIKTYVTEKGKKIV